MLVRDGARDHRERLGGRGDAGDAHELRGRHAAHFGGATHRGELFQRREPQVSGGLAHRFRRRLQTTDQALHLVGVLEHARAVGQVGALLIRVAEMTPPAQARFEVRVDRIQALQEPDREESESF